MKKIHILYSVLFAFLLLGSCKSTKEVAEQKIEISGVKQDVMVLSADDMEGREVGTPGEKKAAKYISERMEEIGLAPGGVSDGYLQGFIRRVKANPHSMEPSDGDKVINGYNVVGYLNNDAEYTAVIGAHYDHLGYGAEGSLYTGEPAIHNGADDNASGVAGMLRLAEIFKNDSSKELNYLFIAFSGEEKGLWGSNYFAKNPTIPSAEINYMINMDMIGRLNDERRLAIYGTGTTPDWEKALDTETGKTFKIKMEPSGVGPSDHTSFYLENIPVLQFFTGQHADYHRPSDDAHLINYQGIIEITDYIVEVIEFTKGRGKLRFTKTKDESQEAPDFKVTLGVIPDYLYDGKGMRIDGVKDDRPAFNANIQKGDIVVKMDTIEVVDMMSYMKALSKFEKGQTIDITIIRDGKEDTRKLTF